jgi:hypothetical protein
VLRPAPSARARASRCLDPGGQLSGIGDGPRDLAESRFREVPERDQGRWSRRVVDLEAALVDVPHLGGHRRHGQSTAENPEIPNYPLKRQMASVVQGEVDVANAAAAWADVVASAQASGTLS